jgi:hypothetical protein
MLFVKNCTFVTLPLLTVALAPILTLAGAAKTAPVTGLVMLIVGGGPTVAGVDRV